MKVLASTFGFNGKNSYKNQHSVKLKIFKINELFFTVLFNFHLP